MMRSNVIKLLNVIVLTAVVLFLATFYGCEKDRFDYYKRPADMAGPIWEQLSVMDKFSTFQKGMEKVPELKRIISTSGLFTVFAPTNKAFEEYFSRDDVPYNSFDDYDVGNPEQLAELKSLINYHILYNMWYSFDFQDEVDMEIPNFSKYIIIDKYMWETRSKDPYRVVSPSKNPALSWWKRTIRSDEKSISIFMSNFIKKYKIEEGYEKLYGAKPAYFNVDGAQVILAFDENGNPITDIATARSMDKKNLYYDINAENGAIHAVNKVITPKQPMDVIIEKKYPYIDKLLKRFEYLVFDKSNSEAEDGESTGLDSLFMKTYRTRDNRHLGFNLASTSSFRSISMVIPHKVAFNKFMKEELEPGYTFGYDFELDSVPDLTVEMLIRGMLSRYKIWPDKTEEIPLMGVDTIKNPTILKKEIASNGIIYEVADFTKGHPFTTVAKVPLLAHRFKLLSRILDYTNLYPYLMYDQNELTFFAPTDEALADANISYRYIKKFNSEEIEGQFFGGASGEQKLRRETMDSMMRYHIIRRKIKFDELVPGYYQTRHGSFIKIIIDDVLNKKNILGGETYTSRVNFNKDVDKECSNGIVHVINGVLFNPRRTIGEILKDKKSGYEKFFIGLKKQGLLKMLKKQATPYKYTVFVPHDNTFTQFAARNLELDHELSNPGWKKVLLMHILNVPTFSDGTNHNVDFDLSPLDGNKTLCVKTPEEGVKPAVYYTVKYSGKDENVVIEGPGSKANIVPNRRDIQGVNGTLHYLKEFKKGDKNKQILAPEKYKFDY